MRTLLGLITIGGLIPMGVSAADWTQFRGGSAVSSEKGLPTTWSATENVRWKAPLPGRGLSNPVIVGNRAFVTASSGPLQDRLHVLCFDTADGKKLWERNLWATGSTVCHPKTNMAAPTPATDGKSLYALFATGDLAAYDFDGNLLWYRAFVQDYPKVTNQVGMASSPIVHEGVVIVPLENADQSLALGIDKKTGQNLWKMERPKDINWVTPVLRTFGGRTDLILQTNEEMTACDPKTGQVRWTYTGEGPASIPSPVLAKDLIVANGTALRPGMELATPEVVWSQPKLKSGFTTALFHDGKLYTINSASVLTCAQAADGKIHWQERLKGPFSASPVFADGKLYLLNEAGMTAVVTVDPEPKVVATNSLGETMLATPAIANGAIYLRSDQHLFCIGAGKR